MTIVVQLESSRERAAAVPLRGDQAAPWVSLCCTECGTIRGPMPLSVRRTALCWLSGPDDDGGGLLETDASEKTVERFRCCGGDIGDCRKMDEDSDGAATWRHRVGDDVSLAANRSGTTDDDAAEAEDADDGGGSGACRGGADE